MNDDQKRKIKRLQKMLNYRRDTIETRDEELEREKKDRYGERYVDHHAEDIAALEWAIHFIKDNLTDKPEERATEELEEE